MFVAAEFQTMRRVCPEEFEALLGRLNVPAPDWSGDEYKIYEDLDGELTKKICGLMKSKSIIEGYAALLKLGGISYGYGETANELLAKVVDGRGKILAGVENFSAETSPGNNPPPDRTRREMHVTFPGFVVGGSFLIGGGIAVLLMLDDLGVLGGVPFLLGVAALAFGLRGGTEYIGVESPGVAPQVKQSPPFTRDELQGVLDVLAQVDKIVRAG